jgi:hypothetical protein
LERPSQFSLLLFTTDADLVRRATAAGVHGIVVDRENKGKAHRQRGADTQINSDSVDDLARVRAATKALVVCRVNGFGPHSAEEIRESLDAGADEILLPMVRTVAEVEAALAVVGTRGRLGILVETCAAVDIAPALGRLPLSRVYVGLNDLMIDRGGTNLFEAVADGTVERVRRQFTVPFGFGGLTLPERGAPLPCRLLIAELTRLSCSFSFLRRSFLADTRGRDLTAEVPRIQAALAAAKRRDDAAIASDLAELRESIRDGRFPARAAS